MYSCTEIGVEVFDIWLIVNFKSEVDKVLLTKVVRAMGQGKHTIMITENIYQMFLG